MEGPARQPHTATGALGCSAESSAPHTPASLGQSFVYLQGKEKKNCRNGQHPPRPHTQGPSQLPEKACRPGEWRAAQQGACSAPGLGWAPAPAPRPARPQGSSQQEQYSRSRTRKQLSSRALGRTSFWLSPGALRRDSTASTLGLTSTSWKGGKREDHRPVKSQGHVPGELGDCCPWHHANHRGKTRLSGTRRPGSNFSPSSSRCQVSWGE